MGEENKFKIISLTKSMANSHYYLKAEFKEFIGEYVFSVSSRFKVCGGDLVYDCLTMRPPEALSQVEELCWGFEGTNPASQLRSQEAEKAFIQHICSD